MTTRRIFQIALFLTFLSLLTISASADSCVPLGGVGVNHPCNPQGLKIFGDSGTGQSIGTTQGYITSNSFQIGFDNKNDSAQDLFVIAAFYNNPAAGTLNGISFNTLSSDPFSVQNGAIKDTLIGLNFATSGNFDPSKLSYGWLDLGHGVGNNYDKYSVTMSGIAAGTIFYVESANPYEVEISRHEVCDKWKNGKCTKSHWEIEDGCLNLIDHINANSEGGVVGRPPATPEPASMLLIGSGLAAVAFRRRRK
jgi:hypothetical protein